jgi:hypothetical protein
MALSKRECDFLKEFWEEARNVRGTTPITLHNLVQRGLIRKVRVDEEYYPTYETTEKGKGAYKQDCREPPQRLFDS